MLAPKPKKTGQALLTEAVNLFDNAVNAIDQAEQKLQEEIGAVDDQIQSLQLKKTLHESDLSRAARIKQKLIDFVR